MSQLESFLPVLACPRCQGSLALNAGAFACAACGHTYPIVYGIPDFRPREPQSIYYDDAAEHAALAEAFDRLSYVEIEDMAFGRAESFQAAYRRAAEQRGDDHWAEAERLAGGSPSAKRGLALDVGCGPGGNLVALAKRFDRVVGLDVNFQLLLLAKKRLAEQGLANKTLVIAASATQLPFRAGVFDYATAMNVIEHVEDQPGTLAEIHRALADGGALFFDSPNRFTLLPEPHVKMWGVGFLPRAWADPYVRLRGGGGYKGKRLLSLLELRQFLKVNFDGGALIGLPSFEERGYFPEGRVKKIMRAAFNGLFRHTPVVRDVLYPFVPTYNVLARKK